MLVFSVPVSSVYLHPALRDGLHLITVTEHCLLSGGNTYTAKAHPIVILLTEPD
jgi:hypothetical protein